jgi:hypothetical protein
VIVYVHKWQAAFENDFEGGHEYGLRRGAYTLAYEADEADITERVISQLLDEKIESDVIRNIGVRLLDVVEDEVAES